MSVINQVLIELEKRGVNAPLDEPAIRSVTPYRESHLLRTALLFALLLVLLAAAIWYWYQERRLTTVPNKVAVVAALASNTAHEHNTPTIIESAPVEVAAAKPNEEPVARQSVESRYEKSSQEVEREQKPVVASDVKKAGKQKKAKKRKKALQRKLQRPAKQVVENVENLPSENPEQFKTITPRQHAENEFNKANRAVQEGRTNDALAGYENALLADSAYDPARRAWAGLLLSLKRNDEAEQVLQKGLSRDSRDAGLAMVLARLQVERGAISQALETLLKTQPYAEEQADYQSFVAALLQRQNRHEEAIAHYQVALKKVPNNGVWLMGMGISLQALQRNEEARAVYQRALASNTLSAQLRAYVQQKLREL